MARTVLGKGTIVTLLASYCGEDNKACTEKRPCDHCLSMCNTFEIESDVVAIYRGQVNDVIDNNTGGWYVYTERDGR